MTTHTLPYSLDALEAAVLIEVLNLTAQGGVTDWHVEEAQKRFRSVAARMVTESMLYASKDTRSSFVIYVEAIAVLAFLPGGVTIAGRHFEVPEELWYSADEAVEEKLEMTV